MGMSPGVHPLLKGGRPPHSHGFSQQQMEALAAVCDTFVPSVDLTTRGNQLAAPGPLGSCGENGDYVDHYAAVEHLAKVSHDQIDAFYRLSASNAGVPLEAAGLMYDSLKPKVVGLLNLVLWLLSTSFGTFLLSGRNGLGSTFPWFHKFSALSQERRERILMSWAQSSLSIFQAVYKVFKGLTQFVFYSKVDANGWNPTWSAIGYHPPDAESSESLPPEPTARPLDNKVLNLRSAVAAGNRPDASQSLRSVLSNFGCSVLDNSHEFLEKIGNFSDQKQHNLTYNSATDVAIECDAVVVGSGAGGGVAAAVLAKAGYKVVVLEKGQYFARQDLSLLESPSLREMYENGGSIATSDGRLSIIAGATLGGGTAVNWSASFHTPPHVLREWSEEHELSLFASEEYAQAMETVCKRLSVQPNCNKENFQNSILREGCTKLGYEVDTIPRNAAADHHCGHCSLGCRNGGKQATTETWLVDATSHGAVILTGCKAEMVLHESYNVESSAASSKKREMKPRKAKGVFAKIDGSNGATARLFISAKATVVACGSLLTPSLLLRSGLKNSNIGKHLHLHPVTLAWSYFPQSTGPNGTNFEGTIMSSYSKVVSNNHHEYHTTTATNKSLSQSADHGTALLEVPILYPGMFAARLSCRSGSEFKNRMCRYSRTAHILVLTRDKGSGTVRLDKDGEVEYDYPFAKQDAITMAEGVEKALRVFIAAGAVEVGTHIVGDEGLRIIRTAATGGGAAAASSEDDDVEEYLKRIRAHFTDPRRLPRVPLDSAHQMGSCRMGIDPMTSAVDPRGETWDVEGLFVADASVFPSATGVNPMVSVQSIAYCTAQSLVRFIKYGHEEKEN